MSMAIPREGGSRWLLWVIVAAALLAVCALLIEDWGQLWKISSAPDNVPIVGMIPLVIFFTWLGLKQSRDNDRLIDTLADDRYRDDEPQPLPAALRLWKRH